MALYDGSLPKGGQLPTQKRRTICALGTTSVQQAIGAALVQQAHNPEEALA